MKRMLSLILSAAITLNGCAYRNNKNTEPANITVSKLNIETVISDDTQETSSEEKPDSSINNGIDTIFGRETSGEITSFRYEPEFENLDDKDLLRYIEDDVYAELVSTLDSDQYFVENVETIYISKEYLEEISYNSKSNIFFGYTLQDLDNAYGDTKYVFTLGDNGETIVTQFEDYDDTYEKVIKNVAIGTGVILVCVTVSFVTAGAGAPAASMIFAASAKTGTVMALTSGAFGGIAAGVITNVQTGDMDQALKTAALEGSEGFKWGAIFGMLSGGANEAIALKGATLNGLTMNEAAAMQKETGYPLDVIKQFHTKEEYEVFRTANLQAHMVNGKTALIRNDIDLLGVDESGRTNLQRMKLGYSPLDINGNSYELHHIGQRSDASLAILTRYEHNNAVLHGFKSITEIDRTLFISQRKQFWITMADILESGVM